MCRKYPNCLYNFLVDTPRRPSMYVNKRQLYIFCNKLYVRCRKFDCMGENCRKIARSFCRNFAGTPKNWNLSEICLRLKNAPQNTSFWPQLANWFASHSFLLWLAFAMPNSIRLAFALGQLDSTRIHKILIRTHPYFFSEFSRSFLTQPHLRIHSEKRRNLPVNQDGTWS